MNTPSAQVRFFQHIKAQLLPHQSLAEEVAEVLELSTDSAYRRIRGEKTLDLVEAQKVGLKFGVWLDRFLFPQHESISFSGRQQPLPDVYPLEQWLQDMEQQLKLINSFPAAHIYFLVKDIPPFYHFQFPELAEFKFFFWMKSIFHDDRFRGVKFKIGDPRYQHFHETCRRISGRYNQVATTEIWNVESLNSTLRQINFYREFESFADEDDLRVLYAKLEQLLDYLEAQAERGTKFLVGQEPAGGGVAYRLFINELVLGDNTFAVDLGTTRLTYLNHSVLYFVGTRDEGFNTFIFDNLDNLMRKSTFISGTGEKERTQFFNTLRHYLHAQSLAVH